jgi:hypothetical protein
MLQHADPLLFDWIERNVPPQSNVLIESGIAPLIDTLEEPGRLAAELRQSIVAIRPKLDQHFIGAVYVGGRSNYDPAVSGNDRIDYAIVAFRTVRYIESRCETFPDVCAFYRDLRANGRVVFETPPGFERAIIYDVRRQ